MISVFSVETEAVTAVMIQHSYLLKNQPSRFSTACHKRIHIESSQAFQLIVLSVTLLRSRT